MKITAKKLDKAKEKMYDSCWWNQGGFEGGFKPPKKHTKKINTYLIYGNYLETFKKSYWLITLCSSCYPKYVQSFKHFKTGLLTEKDKFYLKLIGKD